MLFNKKNFLILSVLFLINESCFISAGQNNLGNGDANYGGEFTLPMIIYKNLLSANVIRPSINNLNSFSADTANSINIQRSALRPGRDNKLISKDRNDRLINPGIRMQAYPWILKYYRAARKINSAGQSFLNKKDIISREGNNKLTFYGARDLLTGKISHDNIEVKKE